MADLIIAPTATFRRDPTQIQINDDIKDQTDAVNLENKTARIVPKSALKGPANTEFKSYHDMRAIHAGVAHADKKYRDLYNYLDLTAKVNGVSFPDTDGNTKYLRGLSNT